MTTIPEWIERSVLTTSDITPSGGGGLLNPTQARKFLQIAMDATAVLPRSRTEIMPALQHDVARLSFNNGRVLKPGTEGARLSSGDQYKPVSGNVRLSAQLLKGEVPISDQTLKANIEGPALGDRIMTGLAQASGRDIEELVLKGDTARTGGEDAYLDVLDGGIKQLQSNLVSGQKLNLSTTTQADLVFKAMVGALPARYKTRLSDLVFYVPIVIQEGYQDQLSTRGTGLGDSAITGDLRTQLAYRGIPVVGVPILNGTDLINTSAVDYSKYAILTHPQNLIVGYFNEIEVESWREPREGVVYYLPRVQVDVKWADPDCAVLGYNIVLS